MKIAHLEKNHEKVPRAKILGLSRNERATNVYLQKSQSKLELQLMKSESKEILSQMVNDKTYHFDDESKGSDAQEQQNEA